MAPPDFSETLGVSQHDYGDGDMLMFGCAMLGALAGVILASVLVFNYIGFWTAMLGVVAMVAGTVLGMAWGDWLVVRRPRLQGIPSLFAATTHVNNSARGVAVDGLAVTPWCDVLKVTPISDTDTAYLVHPRQFEQLVLNAQVDRLVPLMTYYMEQQTRLNRRDKTNS